REACAGHRELTRAHDLFGPVVVRPGQSRPWRCHWPFGRGPGAGLLTQPLRATRGTGQAPIPPPPARLRTREDEASDDAGFGDAASDGVASNDAISKTTTPHCHPERREAERRISPVRSGRDEILRRATPISG